MLRLFIVSLFVMTVLQFAPPGMQEPVGHAAFTSIINASAAGTAAAQNNTAALRQCDARTSGAPATAGCDAGQACANCNVCQVCHEAAMVENSSSAMLTASTLTAFSAPVAGSASAEHARSFKPPIL